jgi:hypothetical protein
MIESLNQTAQQKGERVMKKTAYIVQWWDAYGHARETEKMALESAQAFAASLHEEHDAQIVLVCA